MQLGNLLKRTGGRCHWCGTPLVCLEELRSRGIAYTQVDAWHVTWEEDGQRHTRRFATVDHVVPIRAGGSNYFRNLVASCAACNNLRTKMESPKTLAERVTCPKCGGEKHPQRRKCKSCRKGDRRPRHDDSEWESS